VVWERQEPHHGIGLKRVGVMGCTRTLARREMAGSGILERAEGGRRSGFYSPTLPSTCALPLACTPVVVESRLTHH